ncbi:MAG: tRNA lysidine(34) synthetase TilS, partial [Myxococcota bacterium]
PKFSAEVIDGMRIPAWDAQLTDRSSLGESLDRFPDGKQGVAFDAEALHFPLLVRSWAHGDVIRCFGMKGRAKVGDLFTNAKIPRPLRRAWPVVTHGEEIVWVMGLRRSDFAPVTSETRTVRVLELDAAPSGFAN